MTSIPVKLELPMPRTKQARNFEPKCFTLSHECLELLAELQDVTGSHSESNAMELAVREAHDSRVDQIERRKARLRWSERRTRR